MDKTLLASICDDDKALMLENSDYMTQEDIIFEISKVFGEDKVWLLHSGGGEKNEIDKENFVLRGMSKPLLRKYENLPSQHKLEYNVRMPVPVRGALNGNCLAFSLSKGEFEETSCNLNLPVVCVQDTQETRLRHVPRLLQESGDSDTLLLVIVTVLLALVSLVCAYWFAKRYRETEREISKAYQSGLASMHSGNNGLTRNASQPGMYSGNITRVPSKDSSAASIPTTAQKTMDRPPTDGLRLSKEPVRMQSLSTDGTSTRGQSVEPASPLKMLLTSTYGRNSASRPSNFDPTSLPRNWNVKSSEPPGVTGRRSVSNPRSIVSHKTRSVSGTSAGPKSLLGSLYENSTIGREKKARRDFENIRDLI